MATEDRFASLINPDREPPATDVAQLSGLEIEEVRSMDREWAALPPDRRCAVLMRMADLADADVELDFQSFYWHAMDDPDGGVRECALLGLWECEDRRVVPKVVGLLRSDIQDEVRAAAALTLGHFAVLAETGKLLERDRDRIYTPLLAVLDDPNEALEVRRRALESIGIFQSQEVQGWIRWAYDSDEPVLRQSSIFAMGRSCDPAWLPVIIDELSSDDPALRYEAANASREQAEMSMVPHVVRLLGDEDGQVQLAAIEALGVIGGEAARTALRKVAASDDDVAAKEAAEEALRVSDLEQPGLSMRPRT